MSKRKNENDGAKTENNNNILTAEENLSIQMTVKELIDFYNNLGKNDDLVKSCGNKVIITSYVKKCIATIYHNTASNFITPVNYQI